MSPLQWRLQAWTPTGAGPRIIERDGSYIRSDGLRLPLKPEGEAGEGRFRAKGAGILLPPLSAVQFEYLNGATWTPIYYGQVRIGGNSRDLYGEDYVLRSLSLRLGAVTLSPAFTTPEQPAHLTVRALIQDALPSLNGLILYNEARCPDLGFNCRAVKNAHQQNPLALLEQIAQDGLKYGVNVRFGVGPDRTFFCVVAKADTLALTDADLSAPPVFKAPVAETPCTAVLWYVAKRPNGSWLTHESISPDAATLGKWVKPISLDPTINVWEAAPGTYTVLTAGFPPVFSPKAPQPGVDAAKLTDQAQGVNDPAVVLNDSANFLMLQLESPSMQRVVVTGSSARNGTLLGFKDAGATTILGGNELARGSVIQGTFLPPAGEAVFLMNALHSSTDPDQTLTVQEFRPERINTTLLDALAAFHYSVPASDPADLTLKTFHPPAALTGQVSYGTYTRPVDAWEYRITGNRGLELAALTGQAEDPAALAQASLIKARDGKATIQALTAQT
ncbi:hypothetical protein [Deinococcus navajonensis]|uniref:Uncharacterized protein n=1 Tax=Deinococcus navajonensis TaxID=309884 RepID=A0ABV8XSZ5_9DEIO